MQADTQVLLLARKALLLEQLEDVNRQLSNARAVAQAEAQKASAEQPDEDAGDD